MSDNGDEHALNEEKMPQNHHMKIPWNRISDDEEVPAMERQSSSNHRWSAAWAFRCCRAELGPGASVRP